MAEDILWGPLVLFAAVMTLTPGPNVVLVPASGANFGFRRTIPQTLGRFLADQRARLAFNGSIAALLALSLVPVFW